MMRYSPQLKQFWHVCKILFHNQCLEFFRGDDLIFDDDEQAFVNDENRNFAVPRDVDEPIGSIPNEIYPGKMLTILKDYVAYLTTL